jgi:flagellar hook-basal body complex protein FliE
MTLPISPSRLAGITGPITPPAAPAAKPGQFESLLQGAIQAIQAPQTEAKHAVDGFLSGSGDEVHTVALAVQRADLAFELGLQVRNKVVSAYQEIMRMQI